MIMIGLYANLLFLYLFMTSMPFLCINHFCCEGKIVPGQVAIASFAF